MTMCLPSKICKLEGTGVDGLSEPAADDPSVQLSRHGVVRLRDVLEKRSLARIRTAAERCFDTIESEESIQDRYGFNPFSHSVPAATLLEFGCDGWEGLLAPLRVMRIEQVITDAMGPGWSCNREQSWIRKKFAPRPGVERRHHFQGWHQDGALGARFAPDPGAVSPMTALLTCWIPLDACGVDSPGLEFIRRPQSGLLHFTELDDSALRQRFSPEYFWVPELELGDALIFLNSVLHRTHAHAGMGHDRMSLEFRVFPR
jgi:hypothetical protein